MRTTLVIDDDVLAVSRDMAMRRGKTIGAVVSELARRALRGTGDAVTADDEGFVGLPRRNLKQPITRELVNQLREELDC